MSAYFSAGGFKINYNSGYGVGIENQKYFLNLLTDHGYEVTDTGDIYRNHFLNHLCELKLYGNKDGEDLILQYTKTLNGYRVYKNKNRRL